MILWFNKVKMLWGLGDGAQRRLCRFLLVGKLLESLLAWIGIADWRTARRETEKKDCENVGKYAAFLAPWRALTFIRDRADADRIGV